MNVSVELGEASSGLLPEIPPTPRKCRLRLRTVVAVAMLATMIALAVIVGVVLYNSINRKYQVDVGPLHLVPQEVNSHHLTSMPSLPSSTLVKMASLPLRSERLASSTMLPYFDLMDMFQS